MRKRLLILTSMSLMALLMLGCTLQANTLSEAPRLKYQGWGTAFAQMSEIREFDGKLARLRILGKSDQPGELIAMHLWPLGDLDLGLLGIRAKLFVLEAGTGTLLYYPQPEGETIEDTLKEATE